MLKGWSPFLLASVLIFVVRAAGARPAADLRVAQAADARASTGRAIACRPWFPRRRRKTAIADLNLLALPGTAVFAGGAIAAMMLGMRRRRDRCRSSAGRSSD